MHAYNENDQKYDFETRFRRNDRTLDFSSMRRNDRLKFVYADENDQTFDFETRFRRDDQAFFFEIFRRNDHTSGYRCSNLF